ncbi:hypothetical protein [Aurantimonas endophytica]|jgi:hypothetical protein|uniref:Uncharacterized protein n=1 Tax=Aurantimonas endophytica TaxID=1522175 RepID=A0A7W6HGB9_9HYPH|nr:hypothetical protein [Aurantimonas endophytica]MBB4004674.1 hypothetical protein [Aurantimonas endophytica]MCO6405499.1 hypothetical protein [Aurantimonas endophytica]
MNEKKPESPGGWDAKINAKTGAKDAAGKAMGYEDAEAQKREDRSARDKREKPGSGSNE